MVTTHIPGHAVSRIPKLHSSYHMTHRCFYTIRNTFRSDILSDKTGLVRDSGSVLKDFIPGTGCLLFKGINYFSHIYRKA